VTPTDDKPKAELGCALNRAVPVTLWHLQSLTACHACGRVSPPTPVSRACGRSPSQRAGGATSRLAAPIVPIESLSLPGA
jgi:hypothetical protein